MGLWDAAQLLTALYMVPLDRPRLGNTLTISSSRVRQISDPIMHMLHILHKIIFITQVGSFKPPLAVGPKSGSASDLPLHPCQLPPALGNDPARQVIETYKRALFSPRSNSLNLKSELKRFMTGASPSPS